MSDTNKNGGLEYFRLITPFLILVTAWLILNRINDVDTKLFGHLTNDELHCPRSMVTTKAEFNLYQMMRDRQMADIKEGLIRVERLMERHIK